LGMPQARPTSRINAMKARRKRMGFLDMVTPYHRVMNVFNGGS